MGTGLLRRWQALPANPREAPSSARIECISAANQKFQALEGIDATTISDG